MSNKYTEDFEKLKKLFIKYYEEYAGRISLQTCADLHEGYKLADDFACSDSDFLDGDNIYLGIICDNILKLKMPVGSIFTHEDLEEILSLHYKLFYSDTEEYLGRQRATLFKDLSTHLFFYCIEHYSNVEDWDTLKVFDAAKKCISVCNKPRGHPYYSLIKSACDHIIEENLPTGRFFCDNDLDVVKGFVKELFPETLEEGY